MYSIFDKHGKKLLAVVGSLLVLVFLLPSTFGGRGGGGVLRLGRVDGQRIDADEVQAAQNVLRSTNRIVVPGREGPGQFVRFNEVAFGPFARAFEQNPVLFYLLLREADRAGASVPEQELERLLSSPARLIVEGQTTPAQFDAVDPAAKTVSPALKDALRQDLRRATSVIAYFNRVRTASFKASRPLVSDAVARARQQVRVRAVAFDASDYDAQVKAPADDELRRQFDAYADVMPAVAPDNPFGFGYRVPSRVAVQWLAVPNEEVEKSVIASKSDEAWDEDAILYYQRNLAEFQAVATPPAPPTTRPFAAARAEVLKKLRGPLVEQQKRAVANRIVQQLNTLHGGVAKRPTTGPSVWLGESAYTFEALGAVADAVQKQSGVRPTAVAPGGLLSRDELRKQPGFGSTFERGAGFSAGPDFIFETLAALRDPKDTASVTTIEPGAPSPVLTGSDGLYVARVVGVEPAHAAKSFDAIRPQVERDVRRGHAFALAADAAQAALDKAKSAGGVEKIGQTVQTSDFFAADAPTVAGLSGDYAGGLVGPAFEALRGVASPAALPVHTIAKLRREGRAVVLEVFDVTTALNTSVEQQARRMAEREVGNGVMTPGLEEQWFNFDSVSRRVNYVPDVAREPAEPAAPRGPTNPFMPG